MILMSIVILNNIHLPRQLKEDVLSPVFKKDKDPTLPTNYHGITGLSILGRLIEKVILKTKTDPVLDIVRF